MAMATTPNCTMSVEDIIKQYPIHYHVWNNDCDALRKDLAGVTQEEIEKKDARGRSPLMLAVTLGHLESSRTLIDHGANVNAENKDGWTVVQEAVATGDPELVELVLQRRDYERYSMRVGGVPDLLHKLQEIYDSFPCFYMMNSSTAYCQIMGTFLSLHGDLKYSWHFVLKYPHIETWLGIWAPDFYVEMKWEFTSWVPLVSRMCPSDTYKIYKQGSKVRIDTTLLGFDQNKWQRGNTSFIFHGQNDQATIMEIDHDSQKVFVERMRILSDLDVQVLHPSNETVSARLTTPIVTTYIDTDKISFERNKCGIWGWRQDKTEVINGQNCKVFGASNVELVTKTRTEHLSDTEKAVYKGSKTPFQSFLGIAETEERAPTPHEEYSHFGNPCQITPEEYFDVEVQLGNRDIGRPKEITTKIQKFKATLWLCEDYPLSLPEQIMPIVDLMAISSSHFAKLKNFIQMQLPSGFPVKIEIPLFHVLNARITFGNIFALEDSVVGVNHIDEDGKTTCIIDESCFEPPPSYTVLGGDARRQLSLEEDDDMLHYAIQQSLLQSGSDEDQVDIWEALQVQRPITPNYLTEDDEEKQLQRAIQASLSGLRESTGGTGMDIVSADLEPDTDPDLLKAIELSEKLKEEEEKHLRMEQEMLEQALRLSLMDK